MYAPSSPSGSAMDHILVDNMVADIISISAAFSPTIIFTVGWPVSGFIKKVRGGTP